LANERVLRIRDIRVVGADGSQLGIMQSRQALDLAKSQGLDLVLMAPNANPPVAKIIDFGHYKYELRKKEREGKRKQQEVKGIKISPRIAEHDINFLLKNARRFLTEGHKVKITCQFRAREVTHPEIGRAKLDRMAADLNDIGTVDRPPSLDGKLMVMVMTPRPATKQQGKSKSAEAENKQNSGEALQDHGVGEDNPTPDAQQPPVSP
jgi:translation initiation factor IF-3